MADDFQSQPNCSKCLDKGYYDTTGENYRYPWGDVFLCSCGCVGLEQLESEAIARLRTTNKVKTYEYNPDLNLLRAIKIKRL